MFTTRLEAARRSEEEQEEERKRKKKEREIQKALEVETAKCNDNRVAVDGDPDETAEWQESESGLEWVMIPVKRNKHGVMITDEQENKNSDSDDEDDLQLLGQGEEDEMFTNGKYNNIST